MEKKKKKKEKKKGMGKSRPQVQAYLNALKAAAVVKALYHGRADSGNKELLITFYQLVAGANGQFTCSINSLQ